MRPERLDRYLVLEPGEVGGVEGRELREPVAARASRIVATTFAS